MAKPKTKLNQMSMDDILSRANTGMAMMETKTRDFDDSIEDDPLEGIDYDCQTVETEAIEEISATLKAFKARQEQEQKRRQHSTDSEYWFCLCFTSREEKEAFLKKFNLHSIGDKYLDGRKVDRVLSMPKKSY